MSKTTIIATGDSFMTRRLPENGYEGFDQIREILSRYEVRFNNLEITTHNQEGVPSAFSGGTWAMAEPEILDDLKKFGFNLYNTANNHSLDYSHGGLLATIRHLRERDMLYAGTGKNMADASSAVYVETADARVAMLGVCSTFHDSDMAGNQSIELSGRPGLNGLRFQKTVHVEKSYYNMLAQLSKETHLNANYERNVQNGYARPMPEGKLYFDGMYFQLDERNYITTEPNDKDMARICRAIQEARRQADYVLVSVHSHEFAGTDPTEPADFLKSFSHQCIDAGADAIIGHGPHELRGIEIYRKKPIFYSLGNFIFETDTVRVQPADAYENVNMPNTTTVGAYISMRNHDGTTGYIVQENIWRSVMAGFTVEDGGFRQIRLYPIDLHMKKPRSRIGVPSIAGNDDVLEYLAELSRPLGTEIRINNHIGIIEF